MGEPSSDIPEKYQQPLIRLLLSIADDKFLLGHNNSDWTGLAPFLEADVAFSGIAQDELSHARELYKMAAGLLHPDEDLQVTLSRLAFARPAEERLNALLVEISDEFNWAIAITRQFFYDHFDMVRLPRLTLSCYSPLAELADKMLQEVCSHIRHVDTWVQRLGEGTFESTSKLQSAVNQLWSGASSMFEAVGNQQKLVDFGFYPGNDDSMQAQWLKSVSDILVSAGMQVPAEAIIIKPSGRGRSHSKELYLLLEELTEVYSQDPEACW